MKHGFNFAVLSLSFVLLAAGVAGCQRGKDTPIDPQLTVTDPADRSVGTGEDLTGLDMESILFDRDRGLRPVYFDFDSSALRPDALSTLRENADKIRQTAANVIIQVEGHCDERGSQEYNLALGERRALAVRDHLINLGVPANRLVTISYGHEFPAVLGSNEAAWAQNRRVEFSRGTRP